MSKNGHKWQWVARMERSRIRDSAKISPGSGATRLHPGYTGLS
jgi:hypothetical protein